MAPQAPCCLPRFGSAPEQLKRPMSLRIRLNPSTNAVLRSASEDGRLSSALQVTWAIVLHCYTDSRDICFGYHQNPGRGSSTDTEPPPNIPNLTTVCLAIEEGDYTHELLTKAARCAPSNNPVGNEGVTNLAEGYLMFNTAFVVGTPEGKTPGSRATSLSPPLVPTLLEEYLVILHVKIIRGNIIISLEWINHDISMEQVKSIAIIFEIVLTKVLSPENTAVADIDGFTERDWQRIRAWNQSNPEAHERCIHDVIYDQMLSRPDEEAVCAWDGSLSYKELDTLATRVAFQLTMRGVGPEVLVPLCFDKSVSSVFPTSCGGYTDNLMQMWYFVAVLAVLKAGGAFVPLDPSHPQTRLESLIKDVKATIALCSEWHIGHLQGIIGTVMPLSKASLDEMPIPPENFISNPDVHSRNAAYVIFTSGSTGQPKGTLIEHRAYSSSAIVHGPRLLITSESRVLQFAAHTFDASLAESLSPFMHGACVCVPDEASRLNDIVGAIKQLCANYASLTPSFIEFLSPSEVPEIQTLILAGESMSESHRAKWSKINLVNGFGPSETAVTAAINSKVTDTTDCKDIGMPVNAHCWIVNPENHDQLVPVGATGEMLVEGPTLARGYINNPAKTAEAFIYDPAWTERDPHPQKRRRFYKTGDLVRYNADSGSLTYIGRKDTQIKLHGQRIELGEIESSLSSDVSVKHCVVLLAKAGYSQGRLSAIVSLSHGQSSEVALKLVEPALLKSDHVQEIRGGLSNRLPSYMIPSNWLYVGELPFLPSGKLDRKRIATWLDSQETNPYLTETGNETDNRDILPSDTIEREIAQVWGRTLNIPIHQLPLDESFLRLGGDSIAAMTCMSQCKAKGISLTVQDILRCNSIRELGTRSKSVGLSVAYKEAIDEPFDLSPIQSLHFSVRNEGQGYFNQSILTRLDQSFDETTMRRAIEALVSKHSMLRARFSRTGNGKTMQQRITHDITTSYRLRVHGSSSVGAVREVVGQTQSSLCCISGPLLAVDLFDIQGGNQVLSMVADHLVVDIVSWRIILEDLEELLLNPSHPAPEASNFPFQTWCQLQADHCYKSESDQVQLPDVPPPEFAYWGVDPLAINYGDVNCSSFTVDENATTVLMTECHKSLQTEPVDVILATLLHSFGQTFSDRPLPVIYNEGHGREPWDTSIDISRTVGWFTTLYPIIVSQISQDDPISTVVRVKDGRRRVSDNGRSDFARRVSDQKHDYPMEINLNYLGQHRDLQRSDGLFQLAGQMAGETSRGGGAADFGSETPRFSLFEISAVVVGGQLRVTFSFDKSMKHQGRIKSWVSSCNDLLKALGPKLQSLSAQRTLSDLPLLSLTYESLESLELQKLPRYGIRSWDLVQDIYPCSKMQQGVFLSQSRDPLLYAVHGTWEVQSTTHTPVDVPQLTEAWKQVVAHHSMLRTIFATGLTRRNLFSHIVLNKFDSTPAVLQCMGDDEVLAAFDRLPQLNYRDSRPPHRFTICHTPEGKVYCRLELSHVAMDGASISLIMRDLGLAYAKMLEQKRKPLFRDFIEYMQRQSMQKGIDYWCSYLSDLKPCYLPSDVGPVAGTKSLKSIRLNFDAFAQLQGFCAEHAITVANVFHAAWGLTLSNVCKSDEVCFTYTASLRDAPVSEIDSVVGPVMNLLVCRMKLTPELQLIDIIRRVQDDYVESLPYLYSSLVDIQHAMKLSNASLFNSGISYRKLPAVNDNRGSGLRFSSVGTIHDPAEVSVYVNVETTDDEASIVLNYWTDWLSDERAEAVAGSFIRSLTDVLSSASDNPTTSECLSKQDIEQIARWNCDIPEAIDSCFHTEFEYQAARQLGAPAISTIEGDISYSELNDLSSSLALHLADLGVVLNTPVLISFDSSPWAIISILAVWKAGGSCIPLERSEPSTILEKWVTQSGLQVALASPSRAASLENIVSHIVVVEDSLFDILPTPDLQTRPSSKPLPENSAYVVFTSGTADALVLQHMAILTGCETFANDFTLDEETRMFQASNYTTYSFLHEVFGTLLRGGCVCIPGNIGVSEFEDSINLLQASCVQVTPSQALSIYPSNVPSVRHVILTGEYPTEHVWEIFGDKVQLRTLYGAAECSPACIGQPSSSNAPDGLTSIGYKTPCVNTWVVNQANSDILAPIGTAGELILEGPILAYHHLDEKISRNDSFIEEPKWISNFAVRGANDPVRRMVKTGDLVKYASDGSLIYLGRKDQQVDGQGEIDILQIQGRIQSCSPSRLSCVVDYVKRSDGSKVTDDLSVFVMLGPFRDDLDIGSGILADMSDSLRQVAIELDASLSNHHGLCMLPTLYIPVSTIPFTASGKVDRRLLKKEAEGLSDDILFDFFIDEIKRRRVGEQEGLLPNSEPGLSAVSSETRESYWAEYLADVEPCLFPSLQTPYFGKGANFTRVILGESKNLHALCRRTNLLTSAIFELSWGLVLRCYTGARGVCFGFSDNGFDALLPCYLDSNDLLQVQDVLRDIGHGLTRNKQHQMPISEMLQTYEARDIQHFNTALYLTGTSGAAEDGNHSLRNLDGQGYRIIVRVEISDVSIICHVHFSEDDIPEAYVNGIAACFSHIVRQIVERAPHNDTIGDLDLFDEASGSLVREWNHTLPERCDRCVHDLIEEKGRALPVSAPAVCAWDADFTYSQLDALSSRLAHHLQGLGIQPESFVPLCFEKSAWAVVSQLAILKAGGAFASLDPTHPKSRLRDLVSDLNAKVVLCCPKYLDIASKISGHALVVTQSFVDALPDVPSPGLVRRVTPSNAAYAIFTSGTTGTPKAAVIEHTALSTTAIRVAKYLRIDSTTRTFQFSNYTFDVSVLDIHGTLVHGGCICIPHDEERVNDLSGAIQRMGATNFQGTPTIASTIDTHKVTSLRTVATGGEKMPAGYIERWNGRCVVINAYGPSESTIGATISVKVDSEGNRQRNDRDSIGAPFCGRAWVVDPYDFQRLLPVGAVGELILEGCNVARCYLNNAKKTKESFIENPRWSAHHALGNVFQQQERMYRTGDLVRYNPDGTLTFVSRMDTQIKLNGQRIELEEIEAQCGQNLPQNTRSVVNIVNPKEKTVARCLAVFFSISGDSAAESGEGDLLLPMSPSRSTIAKQLWESLQETLPHYMIPNIFFPLRTMPSTSSGKMDRRKLVGLVEALSKEQLKPYMATNLGSSRKQQVIQGAFDFKLRQLWEEVLALAPGSVSVDDSFFGIGGDSFTAMNLVSAAESEGISLTVADIFKHPTLIDMAKSCGVLLSPNIRQEIEPFRLLPGNTPVVELLEEVADSCGVLRESICDVYPCSPVQEGLITASTQQRGAYMAHPVFKLADTIDITRFKTAWQRAVDEIDVLRTRIIHTACANFVQAVVKSTPIQWRYCHDYRQLPTDVLQIPARNGDSLTAYTISEFNGSRFFVWSIHHSLYDGWSIPLILKKVEENYSQSRPLLSPGAPYRLFIDHLQKRNEATSDEFWKSYLAGISSPPFPQSKSTPSKGVHTSSRRHCSVSIADNPHSLDATLPVLIRAAWATVISLHTQSGDVCFGETLMGRNINLTGIADIAGPVLTTVPTRIAVDHDLTLVDYIYQVRRSTTDMIPHQHSGLQRIRQLDSDSRVACEFQNLLVIQSAGDDMDMNIWAPESTETSQDFFTYPLVIECKLLHSEIQITAYHDENTLSVWHVDKLLGQLSMVLSQLTAISKDDARKLSDLNLISPEDKMDLDLWNKQHTPAVERTIHELIAEKCLAQPDAPSVDSWDSKLSYRELYDAASTFAKYLSSLGVGPEVCVPMCIDKSVWTIVSILGILISGGAFVPLDPAHPISRHAEILGETGANLILCSPKYCDRYKGKVRTVLPIDRDSMKLYGIINSVNPRASPARSSNMAYILFTSGSTGRPKGIVMEHQAVVSSTISYGPIVGLAPGIRVFQFASLTFDAAILEILGTLIFGGCVCIPNEEERLDDISGAIRRLDVSWLFCTPSLASIIEPSTVPCLKVMACGGEMMSHEAMTKWSDKVHLINAYGPTETVVFAVCNTSISQDRNASCIGKHIPSTLTWIVDPENPHRLCPVGIVGELALEGPALAREYLRSPDKTAAAFITDPKWAKDFNSKSNPITPPRRIYLTGDLARYMPDGSIECLGRKDHQVKLHGQRMELGEIEYRLHEISYVRHAMVILPKAGRLQGRLVAILSLNSFYPENGLISSKSCELVDEKTFSEGGLSGLASVQSGLENQLPIYMVPQTWVVVKSLPMLVSGKIDRKKVTAFVEKADGPVYDRIMQDYDRVKRGDFHEKKPSSEHEQENAADILRIICSQILNLPISQVDLDRSFVGLGGDSISGMSLVSRARKGGLTLSLNAILQSPSLKDLADAANSGVQKPKYHEGPGTPFNLSPIQRLYFQQAKLFTGSSRFNQSITVQLSRQVSAKSIEHALKAVVSRHSMLRAKFNKSSSLNGRQIITSGNSSCLRFRVHTDTSGDGFKRIVSETQGCLDIINGPIFAADLFERSHENQVLFLVANHLCVDMVSWRIILNDIEEHIQSGSVASERPLSFQAWCKLLSENCDKDNYTTHLPFEIEPVDAHYWGLNDVPNTYGEVKMRKFELDEERTTRALGSCHKALQTEPLDLLLAVTIHSFYRTFTDRNLPTFYNESHGRHPWDSVIDLSGTVGWFTSICPIQVDPSSDDILETLRLVKDTRRKIANSGSSYFAQSMLFPERQPNSSAFRAPVEVIFNYLGKLQQLERDDSLFRHYGDVYSEQDFALTGDMGCSTPRFAFFEISAIVIKNQLQFVFTYNKNVNSESRVQTWVSECEKTLGQALDRLESAALQVTTSDYPLLPITQENLHNLVTKTLPGLGIQVREHIEDIYRCTPMQEGILLSQLRDPGSYMLHTIFEVKDTKYGRPVDPSRLRDAWKAVIKKHPILRTIFVDSTSKDSSFDQIVVKELDENIVEVQCEDSHAVKQVDNIKLQDTNFARTLKYSHQLAICKTATGRVLLKLEMNHAIIDGASMSILLRDLALAYDRKLSMSGASFRDYIQYLHGLSQTDAIAHWKEYLLDVKPCNLPLSRNTETARHLQSIKMTFNRFSELRNLCEEQSITLANLTLAAWALVLREFTGMEDVCFGYLSAGRDAPVPGIQDAVGIFINMLCCRVKFAPTQSLSDICTKVQADYIKSIPHQHCSLAKVQNKLGLSSEMLFNTALSIQSQAPSAGSDGTALSFNLQKAYDPSEFPVTVNVVTAKGHEGVLLRYWSDVVSEERAERLSIAIARVFTIFVDNPYGQLSNLSGLGDEIRKYDPKINRVRSLRQSTATPTLDNISIQNLIDQRVHEIVSRIIQSGDFSAIHTPKTASNERHGPVDKVQSEQSTGTTAEHVKRRVSTASRISRQQMSLDLEKKLMLLWGSALSISSDLVKRQDSFFRVGGDSIKAMKMASAAREEGLVLTVADVFRNPIFEDMLAVICSTNIMRPVHLGGKPEPKSRLQGVEQAVPSGVASCQTLSLSRGTDVDKGLVQGDICPKIGFFKGGISDVLPVTDFQSLSLTASLFESRWMLNYFYLEGSGVLDHKRLRESCSRVVDSFDILRTVFVCSGDRFYQVILKKVRPSIIVYETDTPLDVFTESLQQRDRDQGLRQGEQFTQFIVAKRAGTNQHRLLIRLSHAQYDGVCMSRILEAIKQGYEGSTLSPTLSFANYMRLMPSSITSEHYQYWTDLLRGSKMTDIVQRKSPNAYQTMGAYTEVHSSIDIAQNLLGNITIATVVQAAWSMTLAKLTAQSDVVFGLTINGRNVSIPGVQNTIGPCLNIVPVRVVFGDGWTGLDLIRYLQDQQVAGMPYESLGFREIIHRCTSWPNWTYFTTSILHQNVDYHGQMQLDGTTYEIGGAGVIDNLADLTLVSKPCENGGLDISLGYSSKGPISHEFAAKALSIVCDTISSLSSTPTAPLPSPRTLQSLPSQTIPDNTGGPHEQSLAPILNNNNVSGSLIHSAILSRTWQQVLPKTHNSGQSFQLGTSFYDLGGDLFRIAQVTWLLQQEGFRVTIEELLEQPTFIGHMAVLARNDVVNEAPSEVITAEDPPNTVAKSEKKVLWKKAFRLMGKFSNRSSVTIKG
ncbi:NRPS [Arachnomyces sp. PD_36]|nr:NRPS [Arachnomyces sp. PD_36]